MVLYLISATATFRRDTGEKLCFVSLMCLDFVLTFWAVSLGFRELNPCFQSLLTNLPLLFVIKIIVAGFIAWLVPGKLLLPAIGFMLFVIGWNAGELLTLIA